MHQNIIHSLTHQRATVRKITPWHIFVLSFYQPRSINFQKKHYTLDYVTDIYWGMSSFSYTCTCIALTFLPSHYTWHIITKFYLSLNIASVQSFPNSSADLLPMMSGDMTLALKAPIISSEANAMPIISSVFTLLCRITCKYHCLIIPRLHVSSEWFRLTKNLYFSLSNQLSSHLRSLALYTSNPIYCMVCQPSKVICL